MGRKVENSVIVSGKGPIVSVALGLCFSVAIAYNALGRQQVRHPAPIPAFWIEQTLNDTTPGDAVGDLLSSVDRQSLPAAPGPSGETFDLVSRIQRELSELGHYKGTIDGLVGPQTRAAIVEYQRANRLTANGGATPQLLEHIQYNRQIRDALSTSSTSAVEADADLMKLIQTGLSELGYRPGPVDGSLGEQTRQAIRRFESDRRMTVTGAPTRDLVRELQNVSGLSSLGASAG